MFPDVDWLLGNHSDELTPWIPVIAAKSSFCTNFFLMPCCAFEFDRKFIRKRSDLSQYAEYLIYIEGLITQCGFNIQKDKLRIPSTKRICFIGQQRAYCLKEWPTILNQIDRYICSNTKNIDASTSDDEINGCCPKIVRREPVQKVKNCTHIKEEIKRNFIRQITDLLLKDENFIEVCCLTIFLNF